MTDEQIKAALAEVGAAWLMDDDDEMCQANALRHLVTAAEALAHERCATLCEDKGPDLLRWWGDGQANAACQECATAIRGA